MDHGFPAGFRRCFDLGMAPARSRWLQSIPRLAAGVAGGDVDEPEQSPCVAKGTQLLGRPRMSGEERELYRSPNGDRWLLIRETVSDRVLVQHEPNLPSGGKASVVEVGEFLCRGRGPEQQALLRLIGSLVEAETETP
jgi:hypothetical protein